MNERCEMFTIITLGSIAIVAFVYFVFRKIGSLDIGAGKKAFLNLMFFLSLFVFIAVLSKYNDSKESKLASEQSVQK